MLNKFLIILISSLVAEIILAFIFPVNFARFTISWAMLFVYEFLIIWIRLIVLRVFPRKGHKFKHLLILFPVLFGLSTAVVFAYSFTIENIIYTNPNFTYLSYLYISGFLSIFIITIFEGYDFFIHWKNYIIRSEQIEKANLLAQYETLRNQLNPHFLFNGLNTLISFIELQDERAASFAQNLSDFLKYLLTYNKKELITLEQELVIVNQYVFLQSSRFENNLLVTIHIPDDCLSWQVPPLTLQMLVENAVKHNKISSRYKLHVQIYEKDRYIYIQNNKQLKNKVESAHVGLENIKGRYKLFSDLEIEITETAENYIIGFPLLRKK